MATCKRCGKDGLRWEQDRGRYWLYDPKADRSHMDTDCDEHRLVLQAEALEAKATRPAVKRGTRVGHERTGHTGTIEALTKPKPERQIGVKSRYQHGRWSSDLVILHLQGDVFAKIVWDEGVPADRYRTWINTRSLRLLEAEDASDTAVPA